MYESISRKVAGDATFHQNRYGKALGEAVREGDRWLDLGAGRRIHGGWEHPQVELANRARYFVGCDISVDAIAQNDFLDVGVAGDARALPFRTDCFRLVTANMVLEHLEHPRDTFNEIHRVLEPGGDFIFVTPNRNHPAVRIFSWILTSDLRRGAARVLEGRRSEDIFHTHYRANTQDALSDLAFRCGFEVVRLEIFSSYPMIRRPALLTLAESLWIGTIQRHPRLSELGSNLLGHFTKTAPADARRGQPSLAGAGSRGSNGAEARPG